MRLHRFFLYAALALTLLLNHAAAAEPAHSPSLVWEQREVNFARSMKTTEFDAVFKFHNRGKKAVSITSVASSCGCTTATLKKTTYAAGEAGEIKVVFTPGERVGPQVKRVVVRTDDPKAPVTTLTLRADILDVIDVSPRLLLWAADEPREPKVVTVTIAQGDAVTLTAVQGDSEGAVSIQIEEVAAKTQAKAVADAADPLLLAPAMAADEANSQKSVSTLPPGARVYTVTVKPPADGLSYRVPVRVIAHDAKGKPLPERVFLVRAVAAAGAKAADELKAKP